MIANGYIVTPSNDNGLIIANGVPQTRHNGLVIVNGLSDRINSYIGSPTARLSTIDGNAFAWISEKNLALYLGHKVVFTDTGGKEATGWIKEADVAEVLGSEISVVPVTNSLLQSRDVDTAPWTVYNAPVLTQNETGYDGQANKAWTMVDDQGAADEGILQSVTVADDSNSHTFSMYFKKTSGVSSFPGIRISYTGGSGLHGMITVDTDNGVLTDRVGFSPDAKSITDAGDFWRVSVTVANNGSGNTAISSYVFVAISGTPASGTWTTIVGSCVVDACQLQQNTSSLGGFVETTSVALTGGVTKSDPGIVLSLSHGLSDGQLIKFKLMNEMTELNVGYSTVNDKTVWDFEIKDTSGYTNPETSATGRFQAVTHVGANGVHIVSAKDGMTRNWASIDSGFDPNDIDFANVYDK